jgi:hypothetical protein
MTRRITPGREEAALSSTGSASGLRQLLDDVEQFSPTVAALAADLFAVADWQPPPASDQVSVLQRWIGARAFGGAGL